MNDEQIRIEKFDETSSGSQGTSLLPQASVQDRASKATEAATRAPPQETSNGLSLRAAVQQLIEEGLLSGQALSRSQIDRLYAPTVAYFGVPGATRDQIAQERRRFNARWPQRNYSLIDGSLRVVRHARDGRFIEVYFDYGFDMRSPYRVSAGVGRGHLVLDVGVPGGQIVREGGFVMRRQPWRVSSRLASGDGMP